MPHQTDRLTWNSLIFHHAVVFLLLTHSHEGQCQGNGQSAELIGVLLGESITLPCQLNPATDAVNVMLEWARPDLDPRFVHVRRDGEDRLFDQHPSYKGRTSVSIDGLRRGDMSLKLSKVTFSDQGTYRCFVPGFKTDTSVKLVVDVFIKITNVSRGVLQCESTGWYLVPEVFWLNGEGNLLSAGPTETVRGPDDLYTVSSRVTVEKRHSNSFTCRVQQNSTNQTRETHIHVPGIIKFFMSDMITVERHTAVVWLK
uniref:Ig-like domain-containing protein n=1 Tax=Sparus aurata TaxID=8175 RepID=A0A671TN17_SPAAU